MFRRRNVICAKLASNPRAKWCRMWEFGSGSNTVPIEKGTETVLRATARLVLISLAARNCLGENGWQSRRSVTVISGQDAVLEGEPVLNSVS